MRRVLTPSGLIVIALAEVHKHLRLRPEWVNVKMQPHKNLGRVVRVWRREQKMPLKELADRLQVSIAFVSNLERGRKVWSLKMLERLKGAME